MVWDVELDPLFTQILVFLPLDERCNAAKKIKIN